ncbi:hypothetical protein QR680_002831 [Steinernema hermaphroditum]|uniref:Uncharacterized protein n=1 Tax=Steinernema hermaphroditum TaxID=289476 RepID=A0AA39LJ51_9BILA|nr:hypothetical protein QR680_002831 [Steinernema hermaphroditum]
MMVNFGTFMGKEMLPGGTPKEIGTRLTLGDFVDLEQGCFAHSTANGAHDQQEEYEKCLSFNVICVETDKKGFPRLWHDNWKPSVLNMTVRFTSQYTQELILESVTDGDFDWVTGAQGDYRRSDVDPDSIGKCWNSTGTNCQNPTAKYQLHHLASVPDGIRRPEGQPEVPEAPPKKN